MANPSWPGTLSPYVLEQGYSEALADLYLETQMEAGNPMRRLRSTRNTRQFTVSAAMTEAQSETFENFYDVTLLGGILPFDWVHPRVRTTITFAFRHPVPKLSQISGQMRIWTLTLEALTDTTYVVIPAPPGSAQAPLQSVLLLESGTSDKLALENGTGYLLL